MPIYKISYVIMDENHPGIILAAKERPSPGDYLVVDKDQFEVYEVFDLSPAHGEFHYVQANCRRSHQPSADQ